MVNERDRIEKADRLDAFWDELLLTRETSLPPASGDAGEREMYALVNRLQAVAPSLDSAAQDRLRQRVFADQTAGSLDRRKPLPVSTAPRGYSQPSEQGSGWPEPRTNRFGQAGSFVGMALLLALVSGGFFLLNSDRGWFGSNDPEQPSSAPLAAQNQATPVTNPSQLTFGNRAGVIWKLSPATEDGLDDVQTTLVDGTIYRAIATAGFAGIEAIDAATGEVKWRKAQAWSGFGIAADEDGVYLINGWNVEALSPEDGSPLWQTRTNSPVSSLTVQESLVYAWSGVAQLTRLNAKTGEDFFMFYQVQVGSYPERGDSLDADVWSPPPVVAEKTVIAMTHEGSLVGFGKSSGGQAWRIDGFSADLTKIAMADDGTIVVLGPTPRIGADTPPLNAVTLTAINSGNGSVLWEKPFISPAPSVAIVESTVTMLADTLGLPPGSPIENRSGAPLRIYAFDLATGDFHWVSDQGALPYSSIAAYAPDSNLVVALSEPGRMTTLSGNDGTVVGIIDVGLPIALPIIGDADGAFPTLADGSLLRIDLNILAGTFGQQANQEIEEGSNIEWTLLLSMKDGQFTGLGGMSFANGMVYRLIETTDSKAVQAVHSPTGALAWQTPMEWSDRGFSADSSGVYLTNENSQIIALDPFSGEALWQVPFREDQVVSQTLGDGVLYVWDESSRMTALNAIDGSVVWEMPARSPGGPQSNENGSPEPVVAEQIVAMVDADGTVHAFDRESGEVLWSQPGFDGIDTRMAFQPDRLFVLAMDGATAEGTQTMTGTALNLNTGEVMWEWEFTGQQFQPAATNETNFYVIADGLMSGPNLANQGDFFVDFDGPEPGLWTGSRASGETPYTGGTHVFGLDAETGEVIWSRSSLAGGFMQLETGCPNSCGLSAVTSDGHSVGLNRENGSLSGDPTQFGGEPLQVISGGRGEFGHFVTMEDGTLIAFGVTHYSEMG